MNIGIVDLGINNLTSVEKAFSVGLKSSDSIFIIESNLEAHRPDLLILPGLGNFATGMAELKERKLIEAIKNQTSGGTKLVGICLGMQLLATNSDESIGVDGLNLIQSKVEKLPKHNFERVPNTGWAEVTAQSKNQPFASLGTRGDFYFVHSYHMIPTEKQKILTTTPFGEGEFASGILEDNILGLQFHPEKSGKKGKQLISEIIAWARNEN